MSGTVGLNVSGPSWNEQVSQYTSPRPTRDRFALALQSDLERCDTQQFPSTWGSSDNYTGVATAEDHRHRRLSQSASPPGGPEEGCADGKTIPYPYFQGQIQKRLELLSFEFATDHESEGSDILRLSCKDFEPGVDYTASSPSLASSTTRDEELTEIHSAATVNASDDALELPRRVVTMRKGLPKANIKVLRDSIPTATSGATTRSTSVQWGIGTSRRDRRRRSLKAKVQHLRDRTARSGSECTNTHVAPNAGSFSTIQSKEVRPKRKHCAFIQERELECLFEDRVGTPHVSELQPGDDVNAQLNVDELSVGGSVAAFSNGGHGASGPSIFEITDIPSEASGIS